MVSPNRPLKKSSMSELLRYRRRIHSIFANHTTAKAAHPSALLPRHATLTACPHSADLTVLIFSLLGSGEMFSL